MLNLTKRCEEVQKAVALIEQQAEELSQLKELIAEQTLLVRNLGDQLREQAKERQATAQTAQAFTAAQLEMLNPRLKRNTIPNDDATVQKLLMLNWSSVQEGEIGYKELIESGFRVFSQNDEDGILLRIFSHIGQTNKYVIEIGSNSDGSDIDIPENISTNLIVNHGWHGAVFELDTIECQRMQYFFARDRATKNFHMLHAGVSSYFSPRIVQAEVLPANINNLLKDIDCVSEPDLFAIDIDGGDYEVVKALEVVRPRVLVVEFERRFRDRHSVVQPDRSHFNRKWPQSGAASLLAWHGLLEQKGYVLCAIGTCGFNAFFIRGDVASGKISELELSNAFDEHPILSKVTDDFWITPDETWQLI